jgi:hypothetical protein
MPPPNPLYEVVQGRLALPQRTPLYEVVLGRLGPPPGRGPCHP